MLTTKSLFDGNESIEFPSFLHNYLEHSDTKNWNSTINNVKYFNLKFADDAYKGKMLEIPSRRSMPKHSHEGLEVPWFFMEVIQMNQEIITRVTLSFAMEMKHIVPYLLKIQVAYA